MEGLYFNLIFTWLIEQNTCGCFDTWKEAISYGRLPETSDGEVGQITIPIWRQLPLWPPLTIHSDLIGTHEVKTSLNGVVVTMSIHRDEPPSWFEEVVRICAVTHYSQHQWCAPHMCVYSNSWWHLPTVCVCTHPKTNDTPSSVCV